MKHFLWLLLFTSQAHAEPAFRGYAAIEQTLTERLLADGTEFHFNRYIKLPPGLSSEPLLALLGTYASTGSDQFQNGDPNSVNMLLWQMFLQLTGQELAAHCAHQGKLRLNPVFEATLAPLCTWPADTAKTDAALRGFWTGVMGYDAPEEEFLAWEKFALSSSYAAKPANEALPILFFLVTYNPHFLLKE
jgi:hypothetical protein